ncbi:MAG: tetratricopeptide repeat protein, partial [Gammaproteobacteria bacterium]
MDVHASEKEQVEALKKWWKENGSSVITGILLGLSVLLGGKAWFSYQETRALSASNIYAQMIAALGRDDSEAVRTYANQLIGDYSGSGYAPLAALALANVAITENEPAAAQAQLQWALDHADKDELRHTARMRLIRVLIDRNQLQEARQQLDAVGEAGAYDYLYAELRGDLAMAEGDTARAARAYRQAMDSMPTQAPNAALLTAKYENVAGAA